MIRISELRKKEGLSQKEFGKIIGAAQNTVSQWEKGIREPDGEMITKIANFFGVTTDYLLGNTESPNLMTGKEPNTESHYYLNDEARQMAEELAKNPKLHILFDAARTVSPEDLQFVIDMVNRLKNDE